MRYFCIIMILVFGAAGYASAETRSCYSLSEAEAEQGIRIHSELMVIGLNCQHMNPGGKENLYTQYRHFSNRYSDLIAGYENTLINYFKRAGHPNPVASLNFLRTSFANKISKDAAVMRPDLFCRRYSPRISQVSMMNRQELQKWASTFFPSHPVSQPLCEQ